jgi:hypothetical protein
MEYSYFLNYNPTSGPILKKYTCLFRKLRRILGRDVIFKNIRSIIDAIISQKKRIKILGVKIKKVCNLRLVKGPRVINLIVHPLVIKKVMSKHTQGIKKKKEVKKLLISRN